AAGVVFPRRTVGTEEGVTFKIAPRKPIETLRREALATAPAPEIASLEGRRAPDLVELVELDPLLHLDVRYATDNNFMGTVFYEEARAFLQRPAAEALKRAHEKLERSGFGLLIHDGYRPWFVTRMFWDGTPAEHHDMVADPSKGSRHNRGCAVDLTLCDPASGAPLRMPSGYDEFSDRANPWYVGGTSEQRWLRDTLRHAMESEGFSVYENEWWHFDFDAWREYPVLNRKFAELGSKEGGRPREPRRTAPPRARARGDRLIRVFRVVRERRPGPGEGRPESRRLAQGEGRRRRAGRDARWRDLLSGDEEQGGRGAGG